ncbi:von Willebrand factor type A domain-containing protein [Fervidobacterium changbaicum]|uniref:VWA domain-containing protein n=1 Tax=Fervidobacterium changbaicum TaxID=310769 RepID=A0ABX5QPX4_9BACT|nr:vWA domain-containing protein [Fervidobacterium changbaicum]QAV32471.1 VWA domain-containing protein [Fervidobacterium changbaicum]SDH58649.1 von Willebrand factor type A domain-containing protein [Fervidobacterium changbaicum]
MKKMIISILTFVFVLAFLVSCSEIPQAPKVIPRDPVGTTKPSTTGYSSSGIYGTLDKQPSLVPIAVPDPVRLRISLPGVENLQSSELRVFEDNREQGFVLYKESTVRNKLDIAIILDVTGSMSFAINGAKNSIINFAKSLEERGLDARVGVVPFDDYVNPPSDIVASPTFLNLTSPASAQEYVATLYAGDGGDWPENDYDAIMFAATAMEWRPAAQRVMIVITDAPAHYKSDGSGIAHFDKSDMLPLLVGFFTIHGAFIPGSYYNSSATVFSAPGDVRELCQKTGGVIKYTDSYGSVNLNDLGIVEYVTSSWIVTFESDSPAATHTIEVFYTKDEDKKYLKLENISY